MGEARRKFDRGFKEGAVRLFAGDGESDRRSPGTSGPRRFSSPPGLRPCPGLGGMLLLP